MDLYNNGKKYLENRMFFISTKFYKIRDKYKKCMCTYMHICIAILHVCKRVYHSKRPYKFVRGVLVSLIRLCFCL